MVILYVCVLGLVDLGRLLRRLLRCGHLAIGPLVNAGEALLALQRVLLGVLVQAASQRLGSGVRELNVARKNKSKSFSQTVFFMIFYDLVYALTSNQLVSSTTFLLFAFSV
jgi:hypothetical protein